MTDKTKKMLEKYGVDIKKIILEDEKLSKKVLESGKHLFDVFLPVIANYQFTNFKNDLKKGDYDSVYSSDFFEAIVDLCKKENINILKKGTTVFRARIVKDNDDIFYAKNGIHFEDDILRGYNYVNSKEPPIGVSSEGRANCRYSSYFYCSDHGNTAASEVKANIGEYISLASFILNKDIRLIRLVEKDILNIDSLLEAHQHYISKTFSAPVSDSQEYYLTQFISDEIRKHGVDGICYKSHFTNKDNYVIFNCSKDTVEFSKSKIIQLHSQQLKFVDFSSNKTISTTKIPDLTEEQIKEQKRYIYKMIQANNHRGNEDNHTITHNDEYN